MAKRKGRPSRTAGESRSIPEELHRRLKELLGPECDELIAALDLPAPVSIRVNPLKRSTDQLNDRVPWSALGTYLAERPSFTFDPHFHAGAYYVQEASSMFLEQAIAASGSAGHDLLALDLCAAPGGKTTHLRSLLTKGSLVVANEVDRRRQPALQENLWKWGHGNVIITASEASHFASLPEYFDLILLDAPCSGEGMMRKDPFAREQWSPRLVQQCATLQQQLIQHAWGSLKPGGCLVYSTCTWETLENEDQLHPLIAEGALPIEIPVQNDWGIISSGPGYRFYPHRTRGEGLFMALLRKPGDHELRRSRTAPKAIQLPSFIADPERFHTSLLNGIQHVVDGTWAKETDVITKVLRTLAPGIPVSEMKGSEYRPHPALALNRSIEIKGIPATDLGEDQAIAYLQGRSLPATGQRGPSLATFQGSRLGWLHGVADRWNNRWPDQWRIRSQRPAASTSDR